MNPAPMNKEQPRASQRAPHPLEQWHVVLTKPRAEVLADIKSKKSGALIELSPAEIKQWEAALKPFVEGQLAKAEKNGVPARAIYGK